MVFFKFGMVISELVFTIQIYPKKRVGLFLELLIFILQIYNAIRNCYKSFISNSFHIYIINTPGCLKNSMAPKTSSAFLLRYKKLYVSRRIF